ITRPNESDPRAVHFFCSGLQLRMSVMGVATDSSTGWLIRNRPSRECEKRTQITKISNFGLLVASSKAKFQTLVCWSPPAKQSSKLWFAGRLQQSKIPNFGLLVAFSKAKFQTLVCWSPPAKQNSKLWFAGRLQQSKVSNFGLLVAFSKAKFQTLLCWSRSLNQKPKFCFVGRPLIQTKILKIGING